MDGNETAPNRLTHAAEGLDFLVIGAQKCATSWLYYCLREHPEVALPGRKREAEYLGGDLVARNGRDWYLGLVERQQGARVAGDVSVNYMSDPRAAAAVRAVLPCVKLVAVVRQPVERAVSAYYWYRRKGQLDASNLEAALRQALTDVHRTPESPYADLLTRGLYANQLRRYGWAADRRSLLLIPYELVSTSPRHALQTCYSFLGVAADFVPRAMSSRPKYNGRLPWLDSFERLGHRVRTVRQVSELLNAWALRAGVTRNRKPLPMSLRRRLEEFFQPDCKELAELANALGASRTADAVRRWVSDSAVRHDAS